MELQDLICQPTPILSSFVNAEFLCALEAFIAAAKHVKAVLKTSLHVQIHLLSWNLENNH